MKPLHCVLLVEDNPADIKITQRALRESDVGVDLVVMRDGEEAVDYLLRRGAHAADPDWRSPDLILLDLNLPRLSGREVLAQIRSQRALAIVPVVVLTTSHRPEDVEAVYSAGANTYIEKPPEFARFVQVLQSIQHYWLEIALLPSSGRV